jgi:hypothetical protein
LRKVNVLALIQLTIFCFNSLSEVEDELLPTGPKLHVFMESFHTLELKTVKVRLPRMTVQVP